MIHKQVVPIRCIAPLVVAGIGAAISAVAKGVGSYIGNKQKQAAQSKLDAAYQAQEDALNAQINTSVLDRADTRAALRRVREYNDEQARKYQTNAIKGGASDEAKVAIANKLNKNYASAISDIVGADERRKDYLRGQLRNTQFRRAGQQYQFDSDTSYIDNMVGAIGTSANQIASAYMAGAGETTPSVSESVGSTVAPETVLHAQQGLNRGVKPPVLNI